MRYLFRIKIDTNMKTHTMKSKASKLSTNSSVFIDEECMLFFQFNSNENYNTSHLFEFASKLCVASNATEPHKPYIISSSQLLIMTVISNEFSINSSSTHDTGLICRAFCGSVDYSNIHQLYIGLINRILSREKDA